MDRDPPKIQVAIRKRPLNRKENASSDPDIVETMAQGGLIIREMK